jgi:quinol-cytochrome oxidoreductase complex cytochrome b subunit
MNRRAHPGSVSSRDSTAPEATGPTVPDSVRVTTIPFLPGTDRERARTTRFTFLIHLRPVRLPVATLRWTHTFGLGGTSLVLALLLAITGILMKLVYKPVPDVAYDSVRTLESQAAFGPLVRGVHYWSANLLLVVVGLHTARVLLTGGYRGPRRFTWLIGAVLLLLVLVSSFTGYLLPWDQLSYWAVTISTAMLTYVPGIGSTLQRIALGGDHISGDTLITFYTLHTTIVPALLAGLMGWHFWRVRRAGGVIEPPSDAPGASSDRPVLFLPHLFVREMAQGLVVVALILGLAAWFGAPLGERANPGLSPNPVKAPWYFVGFQELLIHLHPAFVVLVVPVVAAVAFLAFPYVVREHRAGGRWFLSPVGRRAALTAMALGFVVTPALVVLSDRLGWESSSWLRAGVLPILVLAVVVTGFAAWLRRGFQASPDEVAQAVVLLLASGFLVLTVIGVWFRGEGMALVWPG